jgi:integrase
MSYRRAVARACLRFSASLERQGLPAVHWSPLQVRHAAAEEARQNHEKGLEATQARLRHKEMKVSEKYAHNLDSLGKDVARRFG